MPLVVAGDDRTDARRLQRLAEQGQLRRIHAGVYTDDLVQPLESIVRRELFALCSIVARGNIISHRSALENRRPTAAGNVFLTGPYRRDFDLPGVKLRIAKGPGPLASDIRIPTFGGDAFISSQARALLENLTASRGDPAERRTLGAEGVEAWLDTFISRDISDAINKLRDNARTIAEPLGLQDEFRQLDAKISALLGTRPARLSAHAAIARASGKPYDDARVTLFQTSAGELQRDPLQVPPADPHADPDLQAFIETYFSNYIEGTEVELEEAHDIVVEVHPFADGNGRTARLAMNLFLTQAGLTRIIIPTVYRDDYISALKAMSSNAHPVPLVRMLARAARFSRWIDMSSKANAFAALKQSNALERPRAARLSFDDSLIAARPDHAAASFDSSRDVAGRPAKNWAR